MTYCAEVKTEITQNDSFMGCCTTAHLYGLLLFAKEFSVRRITVSSEHGFIIRHTQKLLFDMGIALDRMTLSRTARNYYLAITDAETIERLLNDFGYSGEEPSFRINQANFLCDNCLAAFISGCFVTGGNITDPQKGYHLEFSTYKHNLAKDLEDALREAGFDPRATTRGYAKVLYFKNSSLIEDILTYMGAVSSSLALMDTKIMKDIVNTVNRRTNCESANIDKTVSSSSRDREAIERIFCKKGKAFLSEDLRAIAELRVENPELSLAELGEMLPSPLSKSGVSHRLRRIRDIASTLKE